MKLLQDLGNNDNVCVKFTLKQLQRLPSNEALESVMCDVIKIHLKRRIATKSEKGNQPLNIKTALVERPILKSYEYQILGGASILFYFSLHPSFLDVFFL